MKSSYLSAISIIFFLGIIVYSNSFYCAFHFDDLPSIVDNPLIRNIYNFQHVWSFLPRRFVLYLTLAFNYHFNGLSVFGYHLVNLGVHLGTALLVWWLTLLTFSSPAMKGEKIARHAKAISLFAGLVFVAHPIQTQAVTYIVQRAASMAALFYLASLCLYVKSRLSEDYKRIYYIGSLMAAIAAMYTKETAITLPLMILLYEFSFLSQKQKMKEMKGTVPFVLTIFIIPLTMLCTETGAVRLHQLQSEPGISSMHYFLTQLRVMVTYVRLVVLPFHQNLDYDYPIYKNIFELPVLSSLMFLAAVLFGAKWLFSKYKILSFCVFWFFLTLLPESSFLPIKDVIYEHRLYLPMVGYSIFLVSSLYYLWGEDRFKHGVWGGLLLIITCYSVLAYQRNDVWRDELTLWNDTVSKSPHKARPYINRALAFYSQGKVSQAMVDYNKAIEVDPGYADAYYNRGLEYYRQGKFSQALRDFNKVIEINPNNAVAYNNRGLVYDNEVNFSQSVSDYNKAIEINPLYAAAYNNQAVVYYQLRQFDKAWTDLHQAQDLGFIANPQFISALKQASGKD